jgi:hypothetical protein
LTWGRQASLAINIRIARPVWVVIGRPPRMRSGA